MSKTKKIRIIYSEWIYQTSKEAVNMRSIEDQIAEITRRRSYYTERKKIRRLSYLATGIGTLLAAALLLVPGVRGTIGISNTLLGSMILGAETGGYIIVALLAFALGITITLIIQKYRKNNKDKIQKE